MIGPHDGQELELMLAGKKLLAAFGDFILEAGGISEEIIPEQAFAPYVASGQIMRFEKKVTSPRLGGDVLYVCFTLPDQSWRAEAYFWIREMIHTSSVPYDDACDIFIGRLLGYDEADIQDFCAQ